MFAALFAMKSPSGMYPVGHDTASASLARASFRRPTHGDLPRAGLFGAFLAGLQPHRFCVSCLAGMYETPEQSIRESLQRLEWRLESETHQCRGCEEVRETYRIRRAAS